MGHTPKPYKFSASSTTDAWWPCKHAHLGLVHLQSENWLAASLVCVRLFLTLEVARRFFCLTLCVMKHETETCTNDICKISCPTHQYENFQISVVATHFDSSCVYHCKLLLNCFRIVNYIYRVVPKINAFLCIKKMNEIVPLSFCGP